MKTINFQSATDSIKYKTYSSPNRQIISIGSILTIAFFLIASYFRGIWSSLFVNLTAGVAIVVFTVVLVDMLRSYHANKHLLIPKAKAITQIQKSNFGLLNSHMLNSRSIEYLKKFYAATQEMTSNDNTALDEVLNDYAIHLSNSKNVMSGIEKSKIQNLAKSLSKTVDSLEKIMQRYEYSFSDVDFKTDILNLVEKAEAAVSVFEIANYDSSLLNKVVVPIDKSKPMPIGDEGLQAFVGAIFSDYIKTYVEFGNKYFKKQANV